MTTVRESVHFLNLLYDHKDYANFENSFSIIMKIFPEPILLQTNTSLEDGNKSEIPNWEWDVLNLKEDGAKIVKMSFFEQRFLCFSITVRVSVPKFLK